MPTPFPTNKTAEELGINKFARKFVIVKDFGDINYGVIGDILSFSNDVDFHDRFQAIFYNERSGRTVVWSWECLAYADDPEPETYVLQVKDRISLEGEVQALDSGHALMRFDGSPEPVNIPLTFMPDFKLLSRPKPKRKVTIKEVEEAFGEAVEIISE